ncbi:MAG TPA: 2-hydroxychromene-2-carboxylate isomerase [Rugosibacter sp.]|jgi:2-hydroxychromene-2-carboxylate isomerase|nr:2-hydroxychromene-2-carboxylate isomerase [Rugosibacter sp.]HQN47830.1 2-hydroxychromene-2-carboxylate isomerase [Rugosibacter sp.]HQQ34629.1 2-hydroxychromene-2-carboxylate isomerase [Rugosibacter sp.]
MMKMKLSIDFWFDFSSPYSYLAAEKIDALAARYGCSVTWHPILLGAIFQVTQAAPLVALPLKGDYSVCDFARSARFLDLPFQMPSRFPLPTQVAARAYYWLAAQDVPDATDIAHQFARMVFRALFVDNRDISEADVVEAIAQQAGLDAVALAQAVTTPEIKARLKDENDRAIAEGVCGAPFFKIDHEPFWGVDRLPQLERWLATGGF